MCIGDGSDEDVGKFPGRVKIIPSQTPQNNGLAGKKKRKQRASGFARVSVHMCVVPSWYRGYDASCPFRTISES